jgi:hypothetical protein
MGAATTIGATNRCRCAAGLCPCLLRGTRFDQKKTLVVHAIVFLSHPPDHSVSDIDRIKRHILPPGSLTLVFAHHSLFASHAALTRQALLSNIGQSRKELLPGTAWQAHPIVIIWKDVSALIARRQSGDKRHPQICPPRYLFFTLFRLKSKDHERLRW